MIILVVATLVVSYLIYSWTRYYFSPLYTIPQPPCWPILNHTFYFGSSVDTLNVFGSWAKDFKEVGLFKFKTVASLKGHSVVLLRPEDMKYVLSRPESFKRSKFFENFFPLTGQGLLVAAGEYHRFQKRLLGKVFSQSNIKHYIPIFNKHVDILTQLWRNAAEDLPNGVNLDVKKYFCNMSFDIFGEIGFGHTFNSQTTTTNTFVKAFKEQGEGTLNLTARFILHYFPFMWYMPFGPAKVIADSNNACAHVLEMLIQQRKDKISAGTLTEEEKHDLLSLMMNEKDDKTGQSFSEQIVKDNSFTMLIAGHETTATSLPGILFYLAKYPEYQEKARKEIQDVLQGKNVITADHLNLFPYTTAFIKESMRLYNALPLNSRVSCVDSTFCGHKIPKGTLLLFLSFLMNKDCDTYDKSGDFVPERYLDGGDLNSGTSFSFGYGPYSCIGKNFAMQEMKVVIIKLLQNFKLEIDPENEKFNRKIMLTLKTFPDIKIRIVNLK